MMADRDAYVAHGRDELTKAGSWMEIIEKSDHGAVLRLTSIDLIVLNNSLNEVLHGPEAIPEWEFQTAERLLRGIADAIS
jgi:hypothetical protein